MMLNERKLKILEAIVNDYIMTAEPISSRSIAKKYDLGVSSATIRNEMSDLEDMELIIQPHVSSGRIPSDKGYRMYVDNLMNRKSLSNDETHFILDIVENNIDNIESLMQETARAISMITNYTTITSEPQAKNLVIKHIQLVPFDKNSIIMILISDNKVVKNFPIKMKESPDYSILSNMSLILNHLLLDKSVEEIDIIKIKKTLSTMDDDGKYLLGIIDEIIKNIFKENEMEVFTSGTKNMLRFPEFSDIDKAKSIFQTLEEKDVLITLLGKDPKEEIKIFIGDENSIEQMKDFSVIRAGYLLGGDTFGSVGIIGPTRMDYAQVVSVLYQVEKTLSQALRAFRRGP